MPQLDTITRTRVRRTIFESSINNSSCATQLHLALQTFPNGTEVGGNATRIQSLIQGPFAGAFHVVYQCDDNVFNSRVVPTIIAIENNVNASQPPLFT